MQDKNKNIKIPQDYTTPIQLISDFFTSKLTVYLIQYLVVTTLDLHTLLTWYVPLYSRLCLEQHDLKLGFRRLQDGMFKISLDTKNRWSASLVAPCQSNGG